MTLRTAALFALAGTLALTILLAVDFVRTTLAVVRDLARLSFSSGRWSMCSQV
jgi:hypothetical protein